MAFRFDPRGDLPPPMLQSTYHKPPHLRGQREDNLWQRGSVRAEPMFTQPFGRLPTSQTTTKGHRPQNTQSAAVPCHDWIFSSASNIHVAIDRSTFKTYTAFKSYVLTVSDGTPVKVHGVGTVELKIRRQPGSKESHYIMLENVLHVPRWICNVFSDEYFKPNTFEHAWTDFGVSFLKIQDDNSLKHWGFTEGFLGLERLVLAKKLHGRSPMLEDTDREVFSVNISWPQGQRDRWELHLAAEKKKKRQDRQVVKLRGEAQSDLTMTTMASPTKTMPSASFNLNRDHRSGLSVLNPNITQRVPKVSSLKTPMSRSRGSSFAERFSSLA